MGCGGVVAVVVTAESLNLESRRITVQDSMVQKFFQLKELSHMDNLNHIN